MNTVDLDVEGMTCAACAARIEKNLNKLDGVEASVSLATERAHVRLSGNLGVGDLVKAIKDSGYGARVAREGEIRDHAEEHRVARNDFLLAALLSAPFLAEMASMAAGGHGLLPPWLQWLLATPVQFWSGRRFYRGAWNAVRGGAANMDVLVVLGTTAAYGFSSFLVVSGNSHSVYFEASTVVITLVLLGKYLEMRAKAAARKSLEGLIRLQPARATVERNGQLLEVDVASISPGERFLVRPGDTVAVDGRVVEGESAVNEAMLTGEAIPAGKRPGGAVYAGTVNGSGALKVVATGTGKDTVLARIIRLVGAAQASKPPVQKLVDRISAVFVPAILVLSAFTFLYWLRSAGFATAIVPAIAVLVIACPCALGLATPTALVVGVGRAARAGILIRNAGALEAAERINTLVLDKTGTLTRGEPVVTDVISEAGVTTEELLSVASSLEARSEHPLGKAILQFNNQQTLRKAEQFQSHGGRGISATIDGKLARLGSPAFLDRQSPPLPGRSVVGVEIDGRFLGWIALADELRPGAAAAIGQLNAMGIEAVIVSGDREDAVAEVARQLGIARWRSGVLPEGKVHEIQLLKQERRFIGMAGDGINDAPALAAADVSFALASGSGAALDVADVTLMKNDLAAIADAIRLSRATLAKIRQNLFFAFIYNVLGIPLAALGMLNPMIAGAAMALSSVSVVSNSLLLNRWKPSS